MGKMASTLGRETLVVAAAAVGLASIPASTVGTVTEVYVTVEDAPARWDVAADPTASQGHLLAAGDQLVITGDSDIRSIKFIRTTGISSSFEISYFGQALGNTGAA